MNKTNITMTKQFIFCCEFDIDHAGVAMYILTVIYRGQNYDELVI